MAANSIPCDKCECTAVGRAHCVPIQTAIRNKQVSAITSANVKQVTDMETDPTGKRPGELGAKLDANKYLPWLCISGFSLALTTVADVTTKGAKKYTPNGWAHVINGESRYMEAFARHMLALATGEIIDKDSGCLHKAQMIWNLLASLELELRRESNQERKTPSNI